LQAYSAILFNHWLFYMARVKIIDCRSCHNMLLNYV
jgi:hypothetical protein